MLYDFIITVRIAFNRNLSDQILFIKQIKIIIYRCKNDLRIRSFKAQIYLLSSKVIRRCIYDIKYLLCVFCLCILQIRIILNLFYLKSQKLSRHELDIFPRIYLSKTPPLISSAITYCSKIEMVKKSNPIYESNTLYQIFGYHHKSHPQRRGDSYFPL